MGVLATIIMAVGALGMMHVRIPSDPSECARVISVSIFIAALAICATITMEKDK